jgi:hypothetical protein
MYIPSHILSFMYPVPLVARHLQCLCGYCYLALKIETIRGHLSGQALFISSIYSANVDAVTLP